MINNTNIENNNIFLDQNRITVKYRVEYDKFMQILCDNNIWVFIPGPTLRCICKLLRDNPFFFDDKKLEVVTIQRKYYGEMRDFLHLVIKYRDGSDIPEIYYSDDEDSHNRITKFDFLVKKLRGTVRGRISLLKNNHLPMTIDNLNMTYVINIK